MAGRSLELLGKGVQNEVSGRRGPLSGEGGGCQETRAKDKASTETISACGWTPVHVASDGEVYSAMINFSAVDND